MPGGGARAGRTFFGSPADCLATGLHRNSARATKPGNPHGEIRLQDGTFPKERLQVTLEAHGAVVGVTFSDYEGISDSAI